MTRTVRIIAASGLNIYAKSSPIAAGDWGDDVIAFTANPNDGREYSATIGDGPHVAFVRAGGSPLATDRARWTFDAVDAGVATLLTRITGTIRTATEDATAETAQTAAVRDGLALEATAQAILEDTGTTLPELIGEIEGGVTIEEIERSGGMLQRLLAKFDGIDKLIRWIRQ